MVRTVQQEAATLVFYQDEEKIGLNIVRKSIEASSRLKKITGEPANRKFWKGMLHHGVVLMITLGFNVGMEALSSRSKDSVRSYRRMVRWMFVC